MNRKIVIIDGMATSGKSTISHKLASKLYGWILVDIWRIKDMFEVLGYSNGLDKEEQKKYQEISKKTIFSIARKIINTTQRSIIVQDIPAKDVKKKLGRDLKKNSYKVYTIQLKVPFREAVKRNKDRKKPDLNFKIWDEERWNNKTKRKIKKGDIVIDTYENIPEEAVKIILKKIGEKAKKHPYERLIRKYW